MISNAENCLHPRVPCDRIKVGCIGSGRIAGALLQGWTAVRQETLDVVVSDLYPEPAQALAQQVRGRVGLNNADVVASSELILLCVKPADVERALAECLPAWNSQLLISIVAGYSLKKLESLVGDQVRVIRAMPNVAAQVGYSATAYSGGPVVTEHDFQRAADLFESVGFSCHVAEPLLDAVTGLSGSGPAYFYLVIEALAEGGVQAGLPRSLALELATHTARGAIALLQESQTHPALLRERVTSPGGTTAAGIAMLESHAMRFAFSEAVQAATERSRELGQDHLRDASRDMYPLSPVILE